MNSKTIEITTTLTIDFDANMTVGQFEMFTESLLQAIKFAATDTVNEKKQNGFIKGSATSVEGKTVTPIGLENKSPASE